MCLGGVLHLEEFRETYHCGKRGTDLEAHVVEESILYHLDVLCTEGLLSQLYLNRLELADVSGHSEIFLEMALLVMDWHEMELQI